MPEIWYRVDSIQYATGCDEWGDPLPRMNPTEGLELVVRELSVSHHTPCGTRLKNGKFVLKSANKKYACPTTEEAMVSFIARKNRQIRILKSQLAKAEFSLKLATAGKLKGSFTDQFT